jgi:hypothetical protein
MGKHDIVDRLNRTGKFSNYRPDPLDSRVPSALSNWNLPRPGQGQRANLSQQEMINGQPGWPVLIMPLGRIQINMEQTLEAQRTQWLYDVRALIDKILSMRTDAKR